MSKKRVIVYVEEGDKAKRRKVEKGVSKALAAYSNSLLVEADEAQIDSLKSEGFVTEVQESAKMIKLRAVEFDTSAEAPTPPVALSLSAAEVETAAKAYWLVQFVGPVKAEWGDEIKALGGQLHEYVPENAFLVSMTAQAKGSVAALPFVNWVGVYEPAYKVSPLLMGRKKKATADELGTLSVSVESFAPAPEGNINIILHDPADRSKVSRRIKRFGGTIVETTGNRIRASLDLAQADKVAKMVEIKWVEPFEPPDLANDVAAPIIGVQPAWDNHGLDGEGEIIGVADSGLDTGVNDATMHDDFEGRIVNIHDRVGDGANDVNSGHGTHVAGSVLGDGSESNGDIRGMAYAARLVFQAIERNSNESLAGIPADYNQLFQQAYNDGARIHTNSWGNHLHGQYTAESQDIDEFLWNHKDMAILYCAMNDGTDGNSNGVVDDDSISSQGSAKNCITVGASENNRATGGYNPGGVCSTYGNCWGGDFPTNPLRNDRLSDDPNGMVAFSGRGPTDDGRTKPDVVAPGTNILSVRSSVATGNGWGLLPAGDTNRPHYMYYGGTSMATPLTAGTVALFRQYLVKACLHNNPSAALLKAVLIHGATPIAGQYTPSEVGAIPDNSQGWGRVNLQNSLFPNHPAKLEFRDDATDTLGTGQNRDFTFDVVDTSVPFRATLVWTDFPSNLAAGGGLVNTLRLSIIPPIGPTVQGAPANNNVQQVVIGTPQVGTYTVRVTGVNVATQMTTGERQDFALVVTAGLEFTDLYIRDNTADDGVEPSRGTVCQSPDIWTCLNNDPTEPPAANPEFGQTNYVFVRVRNRGSQAANNAQVRLYWSNVGTHLSRPHWQTADIKVNGTAGNLRSVNVPAHGASGDGEAITAAFEWTPPDPDDAVWGDGHFCLFATVSHPQDPLLQEDVHLVRWEDNLAWKNMVVQDAVLDAGASLEFYVAGVQGASSIGDLRIDRSELPSGGSVKLRMPSRYWMGSTAVNLQKVWQSDGGRICQVEVTSTQTADLRGISLRSNENTMLRLEVTLPEGAADGEVYPISVEQKVNGTVTGRVTLVARAVGMPAYIANRNSGEIHLADCGWVDKMSSRNKVPYNDLDLALRRHYNGCRFCLPDHDTG